MDRDRREEARGQVEGEVAKGRIEVVEKKMGVTRRQQVRGEIGKQDRGWEGGEKRGPGPGKSKTGSKEET